VDVAHPQFEDHIAVVEKTLGEIGSADTPTVLVFNKIDMLVEEPFGATAEEQMAGIRERYARAGREVVFVSAHERIGLDALRDVLYAQVRTIHEVRYPYNSFLY
jgi:GTP-binding protein HflX